MTIRRLLTATAVLALFQAPAAFAQEETSGSDDAMPEAKITAGVAETAPQDPAESADAQTSGETASDSEAERADPPAEAAADASAEAEAAADAPEADIVPAETVETDAAAPAEAQTEAAAETDAAADAASAPAATATTAAATPASGVNPLIQAAANYAQYRRDLNSVRTVNIDSAAALDGVMDRLAAHRPTHLSNAFIGYSALLVAQQQDFVDQVRAVADYFGKEQVITGLLNDPAYVMTFQNSDKALQTALASADDEEADLLRLGKKLKQQSYSLQHHDWALQVVDRADRLALISAPPAPPAPRDYMAALSETGAIASDQEAAVNTSRREALASVFDPLRMPETPATQPVATMTAAAEGDASAEGDATGDVEATVQTASAESAVTGTATDAAPAEAGAEAVTTAVGGADNDTMATIAYDEDEARSTNAIMTLAALEALGVGETRPQAMTKVMSKVRTQSCLDWAHTQLQVCVAAGHFKYEDAFCIAEHQLNQVGQCLGAVTAN